MLQRPCCGRVGWDGRAPRTSPLGGAEGVAILAEASRQGSPSTDISSVVVSHGLDTFRNEGDAMELFSYIQKNWKVIGITPGPTQDGIEKVPTFLYHLAAPYTIPT